jgi:hypothetical protein
MSATRIDTGVLSDPSWWHWALTVPLLAAYLAGIEAALAVAVALCAGMAIAFWARLRHVSPMPVQVRLAYLALLVIGTWPGMAWIHWVQLAGTSAMVTVGYCPLVRMLTLAPWNRSRPLDLQFLKRVALAPARGGLWMHAARGAGSVAACSCSIKGRTPEDAAGCAS